MQSIARDALMLLENSQNDEKFLVFSVSGWVIIYRTMWRIEKCTMYPDINLNIKTMFRKMMHFISPFTLSSLWHPINVYDTFLRGICCTFPGKLIQRKNACKGVSYRQRWQDVLNNYEFPRFSRTALLDRRMAGLGERGVDLHLWYLFIATFPVQKDRGLASRRGWGLFISEFLDGPFPL